MSNETPKPPYGWMLLPASFELLTGDRRIGDTERWARPIDPGDGWEIVPEGEKVHDGDQLTWNGTYWQNIAEAGRTLAGHMESCVLAVRRRKQPKPAPAPAQQPTSPPACPHCENKLLECEQFIGPEGTAEWLECEQCGYSERISGDPSRVTSAKRAPAPEPKLGWVECSERLPEDERRYRVHFLDGRVSVLSFSRQEIVNAGASVIRWLDFEDPPPVKTEEERQKEASFNAWRRLPASEAVQALGKDDEVDEQLWREAHDYGFKAGLEFGRNR